MRKTRKILITVIIIAALVLLVARRKAQLRHAPAYGTRPVAVHVAKVTRGPIETSHEYLAVVEAVQSARISSRIAARVLEVPKDEGDMVKAGDLLLQLDDADLQDESRALDAQIQAAEATISSLDTNLDYWAKENERDSGLAKQGVIPEAAADATGNKLAEAKAKLKAARDNMQALHHRKDGVGAKLTYTKLTSPFDGLITLRDVDPGDLASPGKPLMVVEDRSQLKLAFDAPQEDMDFLKEGLPVRVRAADKELSLVLTHMYPSLDRARMVRAEVAAPADAGLQIGAFVPLSVVMASAEDAVTVPKSSLLESPDGETAVFVVKNGALEVRPVKKGLEGDGRIEVEGVEPGEEVVTSTFLGWSTLSSGLKVEVAR